MLMNSSHSGCRLLVDEVILYSSPGKVRKPLDINLNSEVAEFNHSFPLFLKVCVCVHMCVFVYARFSLFKKVYVCLCRHVFLFHECMLFRVGGCILEQCTLCVVQRQAAPAPLGVLFDMHILRCRSTHTESETESGTQQFVF